MTIQFKQSMIADGTKLPWLSVDPSVSNLCPIQMSSVEGSSAAVRPANRGGFLAHFPLDLAVATICSVP